MWAIGMDARELQSPSRLDTWGLPLSAMARKAGMNDRVWRGLLAIWNNQDSRYWNRTDLESRLLEADIPVLHFAGYYDNLLGSSLRLWSLLTTKGAAPEKQWILLGPWDHYLTADKVHRIGRIDIGDKTMTSYLDTVHGFFEHFVKGVDNGFGHRQPVTYFTIGENDWRQADEWPPKAVTFVDVFFESSGAANSASGNGRLSFDAPRGVETDHFVYDPANPVTLSMRYSAWYIARDMPDRQEVEERKDILFYDSAPLDEDLTVSGPLRVVLYAASSAVDTDFTATLVDVHADGYANLVQEGIIRAGFHEGLGRRAFLEPGRVYELEIDLWATSYVFKKEHEIRIEISSSNFNHYARNLNTGDTPGFSDRMMTAEQTIYHSEAHPSRIVLPIRD